MNAGENRRVLQRVAPRLGRAQVDDEVLELGQRFGLSPDVSASDVVEHYADGMHHTYVLSLDSAEVMHEAIHTFLDEPTPATVEAAKRAWLTARDDYDRSADRPE